VTAPPTDIGEGTGTEPRGQPLKPARDLDHRRGSREPLDPDDPRGTRIDARFARLLSTPGRLRAWYWGAPALVTLIAALLRLVDLGNPHALVFDETFYVKDSWTLMHLGYEASWPATPDPGFNAGHVDAFSSDPEFVAHPPLGKWIMSLGLALFGAQNSFGWRFSTAVVGVLAVVLVMLIARRLFRGSTLIAVIAGTLMAIDGNAIVMSRVALLDGLVMFVALLGFGAVLLDRDWQERRLTALLARKRSAGGPAHWGPAMWWRPWLITAGALFGLDAGIKWSGFYFLAFFGGYAVIVDLVTRKRAGVPFWFSSGMLKQAPVTFVLMVPVAVVAYIATWSGWLLTRGGYYRDWVQSAAGLRWSGALAWVPDWAQNLWHYQSEMYNYSINLHVAHPYQSNPLTWLFMIRPTSMYYVGSKFGENGCTSPDGCSSAITDLANPIIWWAGALACLYLVYRLARYREWQIGLILTGLAAGYLPWMLYIDRTIFTFYSIAFEPYLILGLTAVIALVLGSRTDASWRRKRGIALVAVFLGVAVAITVFFLPLWTGQQIPFWYWQLHMWLPSWI
jgi:dolichyl-phosphate-mannose-protein mannosyltransferase